ncbi:hypothetical protein NDU88_004028 [Pleurodeles waltl]|uniref:Uncharacterized protein n=1 Tax=Pleurodeles waltl TaxID=8319 RepID=A0AAV7KY75_PLEWA|nr:hypothetical protein NDU88_004028 [Pleurodeles waltl]
MARSKPIHFAKGRRSEHYCTNRRSPLQCPAQSIRSSTTADSLFRSCRMNSGPRRNPPPSVAHPASTASSNPHSRLHNTCNPVTATAGSRRTTSVLQLPGPGHQGPNFANPRPHSPHRAYLIQLPANSALAARPPSQETLAGGRSPTRLPIGPPAHPKANRRPARPRQ